MIDTVLIIVGVLTLGVAIATLFVSIRAQRPQVSVTSAASKPSNPTSYGYLFSTDFRVLNGWTGNIRINPAYLMNGSKKVSVGRFKFSGSPYDSCLHLSYDGIQPRRSGDVSIRFGQSLIDAVGIRPNFPQLE